METSREDNSTPTPQQLISTVSCFLFLACSCRYYRLSKDSFHSSLAQSVEHLTVNQGVVGSSPTGGAKTESTASAVLFVLLPLSALPRRLPILTSQCRPKGGSDGNVARSLAMQFFELQGELAHPRRSAARVFIQGEIFTRKLCRPRPRAGRVLCPQGKFAQLAEHGEDNCVIQGVGRRILGKMKLFYSMLQNISACAIITPRKAVKI